jgi:hypothetical protein
VRFPWWGIPAEVRKMIRTRTRGHLVVCRLPLRLDASHGLERLMGQRKGWRKGWQQSFVFRLSLGRSGRI